MSWSASNHSHSLPSRQSISYVFAERCFVWFAERHHSTATLHTYPVHALWAAFFSLDLHCHSRQNIRSIRSCRIAQYFFYFCALQPGFYCVRHRWNSLTHNHIFINLLLPMLYFVAIQYETKQNRNSTSAFVSMHIVIGSSLAIFTCFSFSHFVRIKYRNSTEIRLFLMALLALDLRSGFFPP